MLSQRVVVVAAVMALFGCEVHLDAPKPMQKLVLPDDFEVGDSLGLSLDDITELRAAVERNDVQARVNLGLHLLSSSEAGDLAEAHSHLRVAEERGHCLAFVALGAASLKGLGVDRNPLRAKSYYEAGASCGSPNAMHNLGAIYYEGDAGSVDFAQARYWFTQAVNAGDQGARIGLAAMKRFGRGEPRDIEGAMALLEPLVEDGVIGALSAYADLLFHEIGTDAALRRAIELWTLAAEAGSDHAQFQLAQMHLDGIGVSTDFEVARTYAEHSAAAGLPEAFVLLGYMHEKGLGGPVNLDAAREQYERAAELGHIDAQAKVGTMILMSGEGTRDLDVAVRWLRMAADQGHTSAAANLGQAYLHYPAIQDLTAARHYLEMAAANGSEAAQRALSRMTADRGAN